MRTVSQKAKLYRAANFDFMCSAGRVERPLTLKLGYIGIDLNIWNQNMTFFIASMRLVRYLEEVPLSKSFNCNQQRLPPSDIHQIDSSAPTLIIYVNKSMINTFEISRSRSSLLVQSTSGLFWLAVARRQISLERQTDASRLMRRISCPFPGTF